MARHLRSLSLLLGAALALLGGDAHAFMRPTSAIDDTERVVNGDFEDPVLTGGWMGLREIPGWRTVSGSGLEVQRGVAGDAYSGDQHVELDGEDSSAIVQDVTTKQGAVYELKLAFSPRPGTGLEDNAVEVRFGGVLLETLRESGQALGDTHWTVHRWRVRAVGASARIELRDVGTSNGLGGYVDAVSLKQVG
jgi:hypothetical protein